MQACRDLSTSVVQCICYVFVTVPCTDCGAFTRHSASSVHVQASDSSELQQLQSQLDSLKEAEQQLKSRLAEAEAALKREEEQGQQAERQLGQMVEAQRRLGEELQEGVEAREDAQAHRDQAQVPLLQLGLLTLIFFCCCCLQVLPRCLSLAAYVSCFTASCVPAWLQLCISPYAQSLLHFISTWTVTEHKINMRRSIQSMYDKAVVLTAFLPIRPSANMHSFL